MKRSRAILSDHYAAFRKGWRNEIIRSSQAARRSLTTSSSEDLSAIVTQHDARFQNLPFLPSALPTVMKRIEERQNHSEPLNPLGALLRDVADLHRVLSYLWALRICVDQSAYFDGLPDVGGLEPSHTDLSIRSDPLSDALSQSRSLA